MIITQTFEKFELADVAPIMRYVVIVFIALTGCVVIVRKKFVK